MSTSNLIKSDVIIAGGGLAGLTLAIQLKKHKSDLSIILLEQRRHPVPEAAHKVGESTVEIGAYYFSTVLGLRKHLVEEHLPKLGLRYFFDSNHSSGEFYKRVEFGGNEYFPAGSFQLDRGRFENYLMDLCLELKIDVRCPARLKEFELDAEQGHRVIFRDEDKTERKVLARWFVDATGRTGLIRNTFGWTREVSHQASSVWFRIKEVIKVDDWSDDSAWGKTKNIEGRRWLSTNHLMGKGYWVWLIPLASGSTSIGIVADESIHPSENFHSLERAMEWLDLHEPICGRVVRSLQDKVEDVLFEKNFSHDCSQVFGDRFALTGEAGLFLDPFYSPGSDFIAMSNTFVTDLILKDMSGQSYEKIAPFYDEIYHLFFENNLRIYQSQYPIFGNARVMPLKILWDFAYYWSVPASIFFHDQLCNFTLYALEKELFEKINELNIKMQRFFRDWHEREENPRIPYTFIDVTNLNFMQKLNENLVSTIAPMDFSKHLHENAQLLKTLSEEMSYLEQGTGTLTLLAPLKSFYLP